MSDAVSAFSKIIPLVASAAPPLAGTPEAVLAEVIGKARTPSRGKKKADTVLFIASDIKDRATPFIEGHLKGTAAVDSVASWDEMANALAKYESIADLTVLGHSHPGGFLFKKADGGFVEKTLDQVKAFYANRTAPARPRIQTIRLQACNIGLDPAPLVDFARLFQASTITATNHFYVTSVRTLDLPKGATQVAIEAALQPVAGFTAPDVSASTLLGRSGKVPVLVEWYRVDLDASPLPPPGDAQARKNFKAARTGEPRVVTTPAGLQALTTELREWGLVEPAKPLLFITVEMAGFPAPAPGAPDGGTPDAGSPDGGPR